MGSAQRTRILLIEDAPDPERQLANLLTDSGAEVTLECYILSASEQIRKQITGGGKFDLILMSFQLSAEEGVRAAKLLRNQGYQGPIMAVTNSHSRFDLRENVENSSNSLLSSLTGNEVVHHLLDQSAPFKKHTNN